MDKSKWKKKVNRNKRESYVTIEGDNHARRHLNQYKSVVQVFVTKLLLLMIKNVQMILGYRHQSCIKFILCKLSD